MKLAASSMEFAVLVVESIEEKEDGTVTVDPMALAATSMDHISQLSGLLKGSGSEAMIDVISLEIRYCCAGGYASLSGEIEKNSGFIPVLLYPGVEVSATPSGSLIF